MSDVPVAMREVVFRRAGDRCEYCRLSQAGQEAAFHIDHVRPRSDSGETTIDNLALACVSCSLRKGAKRTGVDPQTGDETRLFNPRTDAWNDHFQWSGPTVVPKTAVGRASAATLAMNRPLIVAIREEESILGRHPPD